ncbi:phage tail protein [Pseudomonas sp. 18173]|uniref:phage tail protein n=1 Tax=Pseudomonas sp. 18173 TaxID=3390055 RepID=UPI003D226453
MVDQNSIFGGMLTTLGAAKKTNCDALGIPWEPSFMLIGDANGTDPVPSPSQTKLVNQRHRAQLNQLRVSPTDTNVLIAEVVLPADVGGWWIRELALEDKDGVFCAVANVAPSYKPLLAQGSGRNQVVRMHIITSGTSNIQLKIDPAVVLATRQYVDETVNGLLPANKAAGDYTKVTINERGIVQSGSNPTTLGGYGITDALSTSGGDVTGNLRMVDNRSIEIVAAATPSWAGGVHATKNAAGEGGMLGGIGAWGSNNALNCLYMALGTTPWGSGNGVRVTTGGVSIEGILSGNGSGLTALPFASLTGLPNTLSGHGITLASQAEAEAGADTNKPMTALRVFQAIVAKVVQATGSVPGIARMASQTEVNSGTDDTTVITPKKLRWGFQILKAQQGYVVFPSWLGGVVIQWGYASIPGSVTAVPFTFSYPNACFAVVPMVINASAAADVVELTAEPTKYSFLPVVVSSGETGLPSQVAGSFFWLSIGH